MEVRKIEEASRFCNIPSHMILHFINQEWIRPSDLATPALDDEDVARIELIWELYSEMGVNEEAMPIILNLLDQLNRIHLELKKLQSN